MRNKNSKITKRGKEMKIFDSKVKESNETIKN